MVTAATPYVPGASGYDADELRVEEWVLRYCSRVGFHFFYCH